MSLKSVALSSLVEDFDFYPRHAVDSTHVSQIALAVKAGATMPPIVADAKSLRIVDGWHRRRALMRVLGPSAEVKCDLRAYDSDADMLLDAIRLNAGHGRRLDRTDQIRCIKMTEQLGITHETIAVALHVPEERVKLLSVRVVKVDDGSGSGPRTVDGEPPEPTSFPNLDDEPGDGGSIWGESGLIDRNPLKPWYPSQCSPIPGTALLPLTRGLGHLEGKSISEAQAGAVESAPGQGFATLVTQLRRGLVADILNRDDERLMENLRGLQEDLDAYLAEL